MAAGAAAILLAVPPPLMPQESSRVAAVVIEAPEDEAARLGRYVAIKPGEALDPEAVRRLVELIFATGQYEDVVVDREDVAEGSRLVVRPRRAPLLASVRVEGKAPLGADEVRRLGGLRPREALFPADLEQAERQIEDALRRRGYPKASARAVSRRVRSGAEVTFAINAGDRVAVREVRAEGAGALESRLVACLTPRKGQWYDAEKAQRSAERCVEKAREQGYWKAESVVRSTVDDVAQTGALVFTVNLGPRMELVFEGKSPTKKVQKAVERIVREGKGREDALDQAVERLELDERRRGARGGLVARRSERRSETTAVIFTVPPSPVARVAAISVEGWVKVPPLLTRVGGPLDQSTLEADAETLRRAARAGGHARAEVVVDAAEGGGSIPVVFRVTPGPLTRVGAFVLDVPPQTKSLLEGHAAHLKSGDAYRLEAVAAERDEVVASLRNLGFAQAEVTPEIMFSEDSSRADVILRVRPGRRDIVDQIVIAGLENTQEAVVRREILFKEGEPLGLQALLETQRRLSGLGLFSAITIDETEPDVMGRRNVVVRVREASSTSVAYGAGYAERDNLRFSVEVTRRNLGGMNRTLSTFARWSLQTNRFLTTYREPYLRGRRQDLYLSAFREEEDRDSFNFRRLGVNAQTAFALGRRWSAIVRYSFQLTDTFAVEVPLDEVDRRFQSSQFSGPSISFVNDTRDDALDPSAGHFIGLDNQLSLGVLGGDTFGKTYLQASLYRRLGPRTVVAVAGRGGVGGLLRDSKLSLPLAERFFAGGDYSLRGYRLDTAGPRALSTTGDRRLPTGGNALVLASAELRFDIGHRFAVAAFTDAGNVYRLVRDVDLGDLLYSAGAGLRYLSPIGPLRLDWGYKLNRRPEEKPYAFHVTIGHAF